MKIRLLALILSCSFAGISQSTRLVLFEEFTQASCGPCEDINPPLNALLNTFPDTVVSIKYQTAFPGIDPMNAHNPVQVDDRATFYNVHGVPWGILDGNVWDGVPEFMDSTDILGRAA